MKKPGIPDDEDARLNTLRSLNVLDTPAEERFDRLTRLAKHLFNVPIETIARFRQSLDRYNEQLNHGYNISFSEGVITIEHTSNLSIESLLSQADALMYHDKKHRRSAITNN